MFLQGSPDVVSGTYKLGGSSVVNQDVTTTAGPTFSHVHAKRDIVNPAAGATVAVDATWCAGSVVTNVNAAGDVTYNLPAATAGMEVAFYVAAAHKMKLDPNLTDQIMVLTDAAGDFLESDAVVGTYIRLAALAANKWYEMGTLGAWTQE